MESKKSPVIKDDFPLSKSSCPEWIDDLRAGLAGYLLTTVPVFWGIMFSVCFLPHGNIQSNTAVPNNVDVFFNFDAFHYLEIVEDGYSYDPLKRSTVAFFPAYPLAGQTVVKLTSSNPRWTMLLLANLMLLSAFVFLSAYLRSRFFNPQSRFLVLALFGLAPAGFFFRMPYSESMFLVLTILAMVAMVRRWPLLIVALFTGAATAARPVGVAVAAALLCQIILDVEFGRVKRRIMMALSVLPLACWGLLGYMIYQYVAFDAPLGFAQTQEHWSSLRGPSRGGWEKAESLLSGEPIWGTYTSDPVRAWRPRGISSNPLFNLFFWNPIVFVATALLIFVGAWKSWLSKPEIVLSLLLLAIPYVTRAYEMCMASHARFAAVVFPAYIVLARLLAPLPQWVTWVVIGISSIMLMTWTALYAAGHLFY